MTRHPVLRPGDMLRLGGATHTVAGLGSATVRLADVTGAVIEVPTAGLLADPSLELVTASWVPMAPQPALERLPAEAVETARWWERHLIEVITGVPPGSPPGTGPRPEYDPARRSLRQRELAKHGELTRAGHRVGLSTLKRLRARYERDGLWGVIDHRAARRTAPAGYVDPRVVEATRQAIEQETDRSTGTVGRLRRRVEQILAETTEAGERPVMPPERTFYRLAGRLASGRHTFGSARTRRSLANQPEGPFGAVTAVRPGEWTQIDSTPLDVRVVHDDGTVDRVELTGLVDQATRTIAAAVLRPTTKAVDAALLLARALTPEPMRPGWTDALRLTRSVLPHQGLTAIDERLEHAAARPVIVPETIVCDHGKAYLSATFRAACRSLGISLAPAHPHTPTDKPVIERTLGSVATLFAQHVAGYVGSSVERRGKNAEDGAAWSMAGLQALLDEWIVAVWQNRPHDGLRDPLAPGRALTPNERYAALIDAGRLCPGPARPRGLHRAAPGQLAGDQLLRRQDRPADLRQRRAQPLPPPALRHRGEKRPVGGPVRPLRHLPDLDPQPPPRRLAVRDLEAPAHRAGAVRRAGLEPRPAAAGRPRQRPRHRGRDRRGSRGPARPRRPGTRPSRQTPQQDQAAGRTRSPRSRRVGDAPQPPRPRSGPARPMAMRTPPAGRWPG